MKIVLKSGNAVETFTNMIPFTDNDGRMGFMLLTRIGDLNTPLRNHKVMMEDIRRIEPCQ